MAMTTWWRKLSPRQLNIAVQVFSLIAIFFEGYDQGVMGGVNAAPNYVSEVGIGLPDGTVTSTVHQGGIVSIVRETLPRPWAAAESITYCRGSTILDALLAPSSGVGWPIKSVASMDL